MISKLPPHISVVRFEYFGDHLCGIVPVLAQAECAVDQWSVRVQVTRASRRSLTVAIVVGEDDHELDGHARRLVARRVENLVRWLIREEARNA